MDTLEGVIRTVLKALLHIAAMLPIPGYPLFNIIYRILWIALIFTVVYIMFYMELYDEDGIEVISAQIGKTLFVLYSLAHFISIMEVALTRRQYERIMHLVEQLDEHFERELDLNVYRSRQRTLGVFTVLSLLTVTYACEALRTWINLHNAVSPVYWLSRPSGQVLSLRVIHIIGIIIALNQRAELLKCALQRLAEHNRPKLKFTMDIWMPYAKWEYEQLNAMRLIYGHIYEAYENANGCFGWSILTIFISCFFDFVCNAFWTFEIVHHPNSLESVLFNAATTFWTASIIVVFFWCSDVCQNNSLQIGGLINTLVKPLGNKRYNDLITDFSLQVLNQQFVITAKKFFNLNLNLLGKMTAAIVTYLVILIQFKNTGQDCLTNGKIRIVTPNATTAKM